MQLPENTLEIGQVVRFRPFYPGDHWSALRWVIVGATADWADWRPPTVLYRVQVCEEASPSASSTLQTHVRRDMLEPL